jgi:hypothetical protein
MAGMVAGVIYFQIAEMMGSEYQNEFEDNLIYNHKNYEIFQSVVNCGYHISNDSVYAGIGE